MAWFCRHPELEHNLFYCDCSVAYYYVVGVVSIIRNNCNIAQRVFTILLRKCTRLIILK